MSHDESYSLFLDKVCKIINFTYKIKTYIKIKFMEEK